MPLSGCSRTTRDEEFPFSGPPSRQAGPLSSVSSQNSSRPEPSNTAAAAKAAAIGSRRPRKGPRLLTCPDSSRHSIARCAGGKIREGVRNWKPHLPRGGRWEVFGKRAGAPALPVFHSQPSSIHSPSARARQDAAPPEVDMQRGERLCGGEFCGFPGEWQGGREGWIPSKAGGTKG